MCTASHIDRTRVQRLQVLGVIAPSASGSRRKDPSALGPERLRWPGLEPQLPILKSFPPSPTAAPLPREASAAAVTSQIPSPRRKPGPMAEMDSGLRRDDRKWACAACSQIPSPRRKPGPMADVDPGFRRDDRKWACTARSQIPSPRRKPGPMATMDSGFRRDDRMGDGARHMISRCPASGLSSTPFPISTCGPGAVAGASPPPSFLSLPRGPP
jgi:hypothetical protein